MKSVNRNKQEDLQITILLFILIITICTAGYLYWSNFVERGPSLDNAMEPREKSFDDSGRLHSKAEDRARLEAQEIGIQRDCVERGQEKYRLYTHFYECPTTLTLDELKY